MKSLKKLYRDFFGLREATTTSKTPAILPYDQIEKSTAAIEKSTSAMEKNTVAMQKYGKAAKDAGLIESDEIDEAQLVNNITDYRGGVEYVLRDPATAQDVADEIRQWSEKKGFTVVNNTISKSGKIGYFYFRLGEDPALESQKIQGYIAQKPEIKHFRFNVRGEQQPTTDVPMDRPMVKKRRNPNINI